MQGENPKESELPEILSHPLVFAAFVRWMSETVDSGVENAANRAPERSVNESQSMIVPITVGMRTLPSAVPETAGDRAPEAMVMRPENQTIASAVKTFEAQSSESWKSLPDHEALEISAIDVDVGSFAVHGDQFDGRARLLVKKQRKLITGKDAFETRVHSVFVKGHLNGTGPVVDEFTIDELSEMERRFGQGAS